MISQILYGETCEILETEGISVKSKWILMVMKGWINTSVLKTKY